jgi:predicted nucleotidyltransferase
VSLPSAEQLGSIEWDKVFDDTPVILAYLFGSHAEGRIHQGSDIDVAVLLEEGLSWQERGRWQIKLIGRLIDVFQADEVDLLILNDAPPFLRHRVIRPRRRLHVRDEKVRVDFEVRTMRQSMPDSGREAVFHLTAAGVLSRELGDKMADAVSFRDVLVHKYMGIDRNLVYEALQHNVDDLSAFLTVVTRFVEGQLEAEN